MEVLYGNPVVQGQFLLKQLSFKVAIFNPGEVAAESYKGYLTNRTMVGQYAQAIGAATILVERMLPQVGVRWGSCS